MKVLIIEDDNNKYNNIVRILEEKISLVKVTLKTSYNSGLRELMGSEYDLILLDMSLPIYENLISGSSLDIKPFAGIDILKQMNRYRKSISTIIVTQFETFSLSKGIDEKISINELRLELEKIEDLNYKGLIYYDITSDSWEKQLIDLILDEGDME